MKVFNLFHFCPWLMAVEIEAKVDENILTALKAKNYGVQFSDLNLMIFTN